MCSSVCVNGPSIIVCFALNDFIVNENEGEMLAYAKTGRLNWQ